MTFFEKAMRQNGEPAKVTLDKSGANKAAIDEINKDRDVPIEVRRIKYLINIIEQDHRAVKRLTKAMLGFKSFRAASNVLAGIQLMDMIRKGQMMVAEGVQVSFANQFFAGGLAAPRITARMKIIPENGIYQLMRQSPIKRGRSFLTTRANCP